MLQGPSIDGLHHLLSTLVNRGAAITFIQIHLFCHYVNISTIISDDADIHMTCLATHASCVTLCQQVRSTGVIHTHNNWNYIFQSYLYQTNIMRQVLLYLSGFLVAWKASSGKCHRFNYNGRMI